MARTDNLTNFLTDVADSIREKKGTIEEISAAAFDEEIRNLSSGGSIEEIINLELDESTHINILLPICLVGKELTLCFYGKGTADEEIIVDWGDGEIITIANGNAFLTATHVYQKEGSYEIKITGKHIIGGVNSSNRSVNKLSRASANSLNASCDGIIQNLRFANHIETIGSDAFNQLYHVKYIVVPETVTSMVKYAMVLHTNGKIIFKSITPPTLDYATIYTSQVKIYVPDESIEAYKSAKIWTDFKDFIYPISELQ